MNKTTLFGILLTFFFAACSSSDKPPQNTFPLNLVISDSAFPYDQVSSATVTLNEIEINDSSDSGFQVISTTSQTIDLTKLKNGLTQSLVKANVPAGSYHQIRLLVTEGVVVLTNGNSYKLKVPSGQESGIKVDINPPLVIAQTSGTPSPVPSVTGSPTPAPLFFNSTTSNDILLDFDLSKSFVAQGNQNTTNGINGFIFKPTIKAAPLSQTGRIQGVVSNSNGTPLANALVTVASGGTDIQTTVTDSTGTYIIIGVPAGTYTVNVSTDGGQTTVGTASVSVTNVQTSIQNVITSNTSG